MEDAIVISEYILKPTSLQEQRAKELQELFQGPIPPVKYMRTVKAFWLVYVDSDGRSWEPRPFSWQPGAQRWCRIGEEATGRDLDLRDHVIIGEVVMPDIEHIEHTYKKIVVTKVLHGTAPK